MDTIIQRSTILEHENVMLRAKRSTLYDQLCTMRELAVKKEGKRHDFESSRGIGGVVASERSIWEQNSGASESGIHVCGVGFKPGQVLNSTLQREGLWVVGGGGVCRNNTSSGRWWGCLMITSSGRQERRHEFEGGGEGGSMHCKVEGQYSKNITIWKWLGCMTPAAPMVTLPLVRGGEGCGWITSNRYGLLENYE